MALLAACGTSVNAPSPRDVAFTDVAKVQLSAQDGPAAIVVGAGVRALIPQVSAPADRVLVGAFQGGQRTGGYAIAIDRITRDGDRLVVRAIFTVPPPGGIVAQVLTSPAHVVSVASADVAGATTAILLDGTGTERARTDLP